MRHFQLLIALAIALAAPAIAGPKAPRLCAEGKNDCSIVLASSETAPKKFNPGHYMLPYAGESQATLLSRADEVCSEPALEGMQVRALWGALESSKGQYTFGNVEQLYQRLATCKKRLLLQVLVAKFDGTSDGILPLDLSSRVAETNKGYIARLWEPAVMDRLIALHAALGKRFDSEPYFEGVIFSETATGKVADGYSASAYIDQIGRGIKAIRAAWPSSNVVVFFNFIQGASNQQATNFMKLLHETGVALGGPDVIPPPYAGTVGERTYRGEIGGIDYRGKVVAGFAVQAPELGGSEGTYTPKQLFDHCVGTNRCRYMFWLRNTATGGSAQRWSTGILPFVRSHPSL